MSDPKTRPRASLLIVQAMRAEDGSSLPMASDMRGTEKLQSVFTFLRIHNGVLLGLFWSSRNMVLERSDGACQERDGRG